jgi:hypothetical protein
MAVTFYMNVKFGISLYEVRTDDEDVWKQFLGKCLENKLAGDIRSHITRTVKPYSPRNIISDQLNESKIRETCRTRGVCKKYVYNFGQKISRKDTL